VLRRDEHGNISDFFYKRIVFPLLVGDRVVNLTGRILDGYGPKYLHLPGSMKHLYNEVDLKADEVIVVEGPLDCISLCQAGYHSVATLGTPLFNQEKAAKLSRQKVVHVCYDDDKAGWKGAIRVAELIGERSRIIRLPSGLDPSDYFKEHSRDDFELLKSNAKELIPFELEQIPRDISKLNCHRHSIRSCNNLPSWESPVRRHT